MTSRFSWNQQNTRGHRLTLRAIALALRALRLRAIALALRALRLRAIALALRALRLRAIALALRALRLRAIALALRSAPLDQFNPWLNAPTTFRLRSPPYTRYPRR